MLRVIKESTAALKFPAYAAFSLTFAGLGDAFLYVFLPQYADSMNIPVVWIGLLLSINRFVRIIFNGFVGNVFVRYGVRRATIAAALVAVISTAGYGLGLGLIWLIIFRILWGMAFAVLRISTLAYVFENRNIGLSLGSSRGIQELGPMFSLWIGPVLLTYFSAQITFVCFAFLSLPALLYAMRLPELSYKPATKSSINFRLPSVFNTITFLVAFIVEGILIVILGVLLANNNAQLTSLMITSLAAGYLIYRRICFIIFSPVSGFIAGKISFGKVFNISLLLIIIGFVFLLIGWQMMGLVFIFTCNSVNSTMAPGGASNNQEDKISSVAINATWRDIGSAVGAFTGGILFTESLFSEVIIIVTFILSVLLYINYRQVKQH
jgi:MFS transporter, DHA1 family, multidrug resistance protein